MSERKKELHYRTHFVTFTHDSVKLSTVHRKEKGKGKNIDDKTPRVLGAADTTAHTREEGPTVQLCGDSEVAGKWINGQYSLGQKCRGKMGQIQKKKKTTCYPCWKSKIANPISKIDDYVKHIFREHNQEADHWDNLGAEGQRKLLLTEATRLKHGRR